MNVTLAPEALLKALEKVKPAIPRRSSMPVLTNFRLRTTEREGLPCIEIAATDLEYTAITYCEVESVNVEGEMLLSVGLLATVKELRKRDRITLAFDPVHGCIRIFADEIVFSFAGADPAEDYPLLPVPPAKQGAISLPAAALRRILAECLPFASRDDLRPQLTGILFEHKSGILRFVSTDGHRLHTESIRHRCADLPDFEAIVPAATINRLMKATAKFVGHIEMIYEPTPDKDKRPRDELTFLLGSLDYINTRLIDGRYPNFRAVTPSAEDIQDSFTARRLDLITLCKNALATAHENDQRCIFDLSELGSTIASESYKGSYAAPVPVIFSGPPLRIAFNASYCCDVLSALQTDYIEWEFTGAKTASILRESLTPEPSDAFTLLMPVRLSDSDYNPEPAKVPDRIAALTAEPIPA